MMKLGVIFSIASALIGDFSGKYLAEHQPVKLAAAEWHFETKTGAPILMFGILDDGEVKYAIKVPYGLSYLSHSDLDAEVIGLNEFPEDEWPPLYIHYLFDSMVMIGMWMVLLSLMYVLGLWRKWRFVMSKTYKWLIVLGGPLSIIAIEAGWWLTEVGRQPWVLRGIQRTEDAATTSGQVDTMLLLFAGLYLILGIGSAVVLIRMFRNNPVEQELADRTAEEEGVRL